MPGDKANVIEEILYYGYTDRHVASSFRLENLGDPESLVGLLYYLGLLSYGKTEDGFICPVITTQVVREQYYTYLAKYYNEHTEWHTDYREIGELGREAARFGNALPLIEYICRYNSPERNLWCQNKPHFLADKSNLLVILQQK